VRHSFEKGTVAAALPVHPNTLRDRVARIGEITGVESERVEGPGLAWLAWLARGDATPARGRTSDPRGGARRVFPID
jgi:hypothetical protein